MVRQLTEKELLRIHLAIANVHYGNHKITPIQWDACHDVAIAVAIELEHQGHIKIDRLVLSSFMGGKL